MRVYRYVQVIGLSLLMIFEIIEPLTPILLVAYVLTSIEFMINFDLNDRYYESVTQLLVMIPAILFQIYEIMANNRIRIEMSGLLTYSIVFLILRLLVWVYVDVTNGLINRYLAQLRYVEDANAVNQQLIENQEKVKKANEQLAEQKVQLEFANTKIHNVYSEILLQNTILKLISDHHEIERLFSLIVETIRSQMNVDTFAIYLVPKAVQSRNLICQVKSMFGMKYQQFLKDKIEAGVLEPYLRNRETYVDNHVDASQYSFVQHNEVSSLMIIPLIKAEEMIGALYIADTKYDAFIDNVPFFEATVSSINIAIENINLYAKLEEKAIKDELTNIYNRRYLNQVCDQFIFEAIRDKTPLSVALFDIDKFKNINDSYGHLFGDEALKLVASMASELAESTGGVAGRYGGEEFVVLFPNRDLASTHEVVITYHEAVRQTAFCYENERVEVRLSVGISSFPETCQNPNDLLNYADWAMYYSKENGRDRITIDSEEIREQVRLK